MKNNRTIALSKYKYGYFLSILFLLFPANNREKNCKRLFFSALKKINSPVIFVISLLFSLLFACYFFAFFYVKIHTSF